MKYTAYALTTIDNPYDPFVQFDAWYNFDLNRELTHRGEGYVNCCSILDRFAYTSDGLSETENIDAIENAIDRIIKLDATNVYKKIRREIEDSKEIDSEDSNLYDITSKFLKK